MRNVVRCSQPPSNIVAKTHPCIEFIEEAEPGGQLEFQPGVEVGRVGLAGRKSGEELFDGFQGQHVVDRVSAGSVKGSSLACGLPTNTRRETCHIATLGQSSYENSPPKTRSSFAPDYRPFRFLRLRASGLQRLATTPHSR